MIFNRLSNRSWFPCIKSNQHGTVLIFVIIIAFIGSLVMSSVLFSSRYSNKKISHKRNDVELLNIAEGGLQAALAKLRHTDITLIGDQSATLIPSTVLGNGFYEVVYSNYIPGNSLSLLAKGMIGHREKVIDAKVKIYCKGIVFDITDGKAIPQESFTPTVTILGAAVTYGTDGYIVPVTIEVNIGSNSYYPFGSIDLPVDGNVNDNNNPRTYNVPDSHTSGTPVSLRLKSWLKKKSYYSGTQNSHWQLHREVNSTPDNGWVKVLRDRDSVPDLDGFGSQEDVQTFIRSYVDTTELVMNLGPNDAIYLVEFGAQTGTSADYQDCVILVTLDGTPSLGGDCNSWSYEISKWKEQ